MRSMKISCIQMNMLPQLPGKNFERAAELIKKAAEEKPDVIVLPEMWNTGFFPREGLFDLCDHNGARVKSEIGGLAKELSVNIVSGSVANIKYGKIYNTSYVFDRDGNCTAEYDKTHLFTPMGEHLSFEKGENLCTFQLDGVKCAVVICYDIRFPELIRTLALKDIKVLFTVAQWPQVRIPHLLTLTRARAIENQMFVACCNSCGSFSSTVYGGSSVIYDPWGETLCAAGGEEEIIFADCALSEIDEIRGSINVFCDRRPELYQQNY